MRRGAALEIDLEIRGGRSRFGAVPTSTSFFGHTVDLRGSEAGLSVPSPVRGSPVRADGGAEFSQNAERCPGRSNFPGIWRPCATFIFLLRKTRKRHGSSRRSPFSFFAAIQRHVLAQGQGWVVLARQGTVPVAGAVYFTFARKVIYKYAASDENFQHLRANNLVMWEAIKRHAQEGCETLDLGRTDLQNEGLRKYKLAWGAAERPVEYVRRDCRTGRFAGCRRPRAAWQTRIFRMLPDRFLQLIGAALYRHAA